MLGEQAWANRKQVVQRKVFWRLLLFLSALHWSFVWEEKPPTPLNTVLNHGEGRKLKGRQFQKGEREWWGGGKQSRRETHFW